MMRKWAIRALTALAGVYLIACGVFWAFQQRMIYPAPWSRPLETCPTPPGAALWSHEGERGVFTASGLDTASASGARRLAVFYHGNSETACNWRFMGVNHLAPLGYDALVLEYPGYAGDDRGTSIGAMRRLTATVNAWITAQDYDYVAVIGFSIGSGVAAIHAEQGRVDQVLLMAPFDRLIHVIRDIGFPAPRFLLTEDFDSIAALTTAGAPTAILHGDADRLIYSKRSAALAQALEAAGIQVSRQIVPGAGHNGLFGAAVFDVFLSQNLR